MMNLIWNVQTEPTVMAALAGAVVGAIITITGTLLLEHLKEIKKRKFCTFLLYSDLERIKDYVIYERGSINLEISKEWKTWLFYCNYLTSDEIKFIKMIYDMAEKYHYYFEIEKVKGTYKEDIMSYVELKKLIIENTDEGKVNCRCSKEYEKVIARLRAKGL